MNISECSLIGWEIWLADKSFLCLSASLHSVDAQRNVPLLEDMADIFTNLAFYIAVC